MSAQSKDGFLALCGSLSGLSITVIGMRFYSRKKQRLPIQMDDALAAAALVTYLGAASIEFYKVHIKAIGYSFHDLSSAEMKGIARHSTKLSFAYDDLTNATAGFIKLSALFYYLRIFCIPGVPDWVGRASKMTMVLVSLWIVLYLILPFFQCGTHWTALYDGTSTKYCTLQAPIFVSLAVSNLVLDLWLLTIPIPRILQMHVSRSKQFSIMGVFLLAFIGVGASIVRVVIFIQFAVGGINYLSHHDSGHAQTKITYFTMLEAGISLVAVNLPSLWLLLSTEIPQRVVHNFRKMRSLTSPHSSEPKAAAGDEAIMKNTANTAYLGESWAAVSPSNPSHPFVDLEAHKTGILGVRRIEALQKSG